MRCFACIVWSYCGTFWLFLLLSISFYLFLQVVLSDLSAVVFFLSLHFDGFLNVLFSKAVSLVLAYFFYLPSKPYFLSYFVFMLGFFCLPSCVNIYVVVLCSKMICFFNILFKFFWRALGIFLMIYLFICFYYLKVWQLAFKINLV